MERKHDTVITGMKDSRAGRLTHPLLYKTDGSETGNTATAARPLGLHPCNEVLQIPNFFHVSLKVQH